MTQPDSTTSERSPLAGQTSGKLRRWLALCASKNIVRRALVTSLIVGTILVIINHSDALLAGQIDTTRLLRMLLTYAVPYLVSTTSSASTLLNYEFHP